MWSTQEDPEFFQMFLYSLKNYFGYIRTLAAREERKYLSSFHTPFFKELHNHSFLPLVEEIFLPPKLPQQEDVKSLLMLLERLAEALREYPSIHTG